MFLKIVFCAVLSAGLILCIIMWVEVSAGMDVKGAGAFKIPITVSVKRFGISERYSK